LIDQSKTEHKLKKYYVGQLKLNIFFGTQMTLNQIALKKQYD